MAEKMAERIAEILKGPNFQTAEKALTDFLASDFFRDKQDPVYSHDIICKCTGVLQVFVISRFCYFSI